MKAFLCFSVLLRFLASHAAARLVCSSSPSSPPSSSSSSSSSPPSSPAIWQHLISLPAIRHAANLFPTLNCDTSSSTMSDIVLCASRDVIAKSANVIGQLQLPQTIIAADGMFNVSVANDFFMASNILLLAEPSLPQQVLCAAVSALTTSAELQSAVCGCWNGRPLTELVSSGSSIDTSLLSMCAVYPCQRPQCTIIVDPNQRSCISAPNDYAVTYSLTTPRILFPSPPEALLANLPPQVAAFLGHFSVGLSYVLSFFNSYHISFVLGLLILHNAEDIASLEIARVLVSIVLGVFLAVLSLLLLLYKTGHSYFRSGVSYIDVFLQPSAAAFIASIAYFMMNSSFLSFIVDYMVIFWDTGAFNLPWLGKAYFMVSIGITLLGVYRWDFFAPDTLSFTALHTFIIWCASSLLLASTSHSLLGIALMCYGLFSSAVAEFCRPYMVYIIGYFQTPLYKYTGVKLSMRQYDEATAASTTSSIQQLRDFYKTSPGAYSRMMSIYTKTGKIQEAMLLEQFMLGTYAGRPVSPGEDEGKSTSTLIRVVVVLLCCAVTFGCVYVGYVHGLN